MSLRKLVYRDGQKAVLYRSRMNPSLGRNFEAMDALEWLARMSDHIPDPGPPAISDVVHAKGVVSPSPRLADVQQLAGTLVASGLAPAALFPAGRRG